MADDYLDLNEKLLSTFSIGKAFPPQASEIDSLDISSDGLFALTAVSGEGVLNIYDCIHGTLHRKIGNIKHGIKEALFTHANTALVYAAAKTPALLYHSLSDNKILQTYTGHKTIINQICLSPLDDMLITTAPTDSLRVWDLRTPRCQGILPLGCLAPLACFDPEGLIFCVALGSRYIRLYDARNYSAGPFTIFELHGSRQTDEWKGISFSPNGKFLLIETAVGTTLLLDAFDGQCLHSILQEPARANTVFTPDSNFLMTGSDNGELLFWDYQNKKKIYTWKAHPAPVSKVAFNPIYLTAITTSLQTVFWIAEE